MIIVPITCCLTDFLVKAFMHNYRPTPYAIISEIQKFGLGSKEVGAESSANLERESSELLRHVGIMHPPSGTHRSYSPAPFIAQMIPDVRVLKTESPHPIASVPPHDVVETRVK